MVITSYEYILFVIIGFIIYCYVPRKIQWVILLFQSVIFYVLNTQVYTIIYLLFTVISTWGATVYFDYLKTKRGNTKYKKIVLICTMLVNFLILAVLKYTNLAINTINIFLLEIGDNKIYNVEWLAPLAISFYTLQIMAYLLDAYWGIIDIQKNPFRLLLYTIYFPLMISGPICKYSIIGKQLFEEHRFDYERVTDGIRRIAWGMAKKFVVADRITDVVGIMFDSQNIFSGYWVWISGLFFLIQLYFDFSGCMDIVIGVSKCFGIILPENFNAPLWSRTIQEFWQRWHISLGNWLKEYIMYPFLKTEFVIKWNDKTGKYGKKISTYIALFLVWTAMGVWHGNSWKYVVGEGWWFWLIIVLGQETKKKSLRIKNIIKIKDNNCIWKLFQRCRTLLLVSVGMVFFRANSLKDACSRVLNSLNNVNNDRALTYLKDTVLEVFGKTWIIAGILLIIVLQLICEYRKYNKKDIQNIIVRQRAPIRWFLYCGLLFIIVLCGKFEQSSFIYVGF